MEIIKKITGSTFVVELYGESKDFDYSIELNEKKEGLEYVKFTMTSNNETTPAPVKIFFTYPGVKIHSRWNPGLDFSRGVVPYWYGDVSDLGRNRSNLASGAPVETYVSYEGKNQLTMAFSDASNPLEIVTGINEETAQLYCCVTLFSEPMAPISQYEGTLRLDTREIPYYQSLKEVQQWWEGMSGYEPIEAPWQATRPFYSTWYSFHQMVDTDEILNQCRLSKNLGFESIIIDDGWQTEDNNRGYRFCGDWEVASKKVPDMKAFVSSVHDIGMKLLLWYSVPFVGCDSKVWKRFQGKLLNPEKTDWCVLDPRFPDVREYLITTYEEAVLNWDVDGFKLDFVDEFTLKKCTDYNMESGRDYKSVPEAVDRLLKDVIGRLKQIKPDIMIEFRQTYVGPLMRTYGNIFRATDCPNDSLTNRLRTIDVRLLSGSTAVHSDMLMWSDADTVESAAMQVINILFSVPQISVLIDKISNTHYKMLKFWMKFWLENKDVLMDGEFMPMHPEANYSVVMASNSEKLLAVAYANPVITLPEALPEQLVIVNGMYENRLIIESKQDLGTMKSKIFDCCGDTIYTGEINIAKGVNKIDVPVAGALTMEKL